MLDDSHRPAAVGTAASGAVAVVEDDEMSRHAIGRLLQAGGFEPALFDCAETFLASSSSRSWLCLIVDVQLPGMSGLDLQRKIHSEHSQVPVIVTTGNRAEAIRERARQDGCAAFLLKPFSAETILALLSSFAARFHP